MVILLEKISRAQAVMNNGSRLCTVEDKMVKSTVSVQTRIFILVNGRRRFKYLLVLMNTVVRNVAYSWNNLRNICKCECMAGDIHSCEELALRVSPGPLPIGQRYQEQRFDTALAATCCFREVMSPEAGLSGFSRMTVRSPFLPGLRRYTSSAAFATSCVCNACL